MSASFAAVSARQLIVAELQKARFARASDASEGAVDAKGGQQVRMNGRKAAIPRYLIRSAQWAGRRVGWSQEWRLLIGRSGGNLGEDASSFTRVAAPRGHFWADPCVVIEDGQPHVFFEDYEHRDRKGRIAVMTIGPSGRCGPAHRVLETDVHLSYPFVFRHQGRLYMVPESADAESVDLYECVHFPCDWVFRRNLLSGVRLVDATLARWNDVWWMFASYQHPDGLRGADLLMLYFSEDPVEGEWKRHPASPLMADVTRARSAGSLFVHSGRLYRPSQDGSRGYGSAIAINEVLQLDDRTYVERRVETVSPPCGAFGTHTISRAGGIAVMDACAWMPRWRAT
jgi:hypothetical protein